MPLVALARSELDNDGKIVYIGDYDFPKIALEGCDLFCPGCMDGMFIREKRMTVAHFVHKRRDGGSCAYRDMDGGESEQHRLAKIAIRDLLLDDPIYRDANIQVERYVPGDSPRIADVYVEFDFGDVEIYEIQLAAITTETLEQRTADYERALAVDGRSVNVFWCLGGKADVEANREWCEVRTKFACSIAIEQSINWTNLSPYLYPNRLQGAAKNN